MVDGRIVANLHRGSTPRSLGVADSRLGLDRVTTWCIQNLGVPTPQIPQAMQGNLGSPCELAWQAAAEAFQQPHVRGVPNGVAVRV